MSEKFKKNQKLVKALELLTGAVQFDDENLIIRNIVGSTEDKDRYGDVVVQEGWELDNYRKNPVILYGHKSRELPIGKAISVEVRDNRLMFDIQFATHEFAREIYELIKGGFLNAFSVGFMTLEWSFDEKNDVWEILKAELLELSVVPVPANQEALVERVNKAFAATKGFEVEESIKEDGEEEETEIEGKPKDEAKCTCGHCQKHAELFITREDAEKMIKAEVSAQMKAFRTNQVASEESAASPSKLTLAQAVNVQLEVKEANKATGKLLKAINLLTSQKD